MVGTNPRHRRKENPKPTVEVRRAGAFHRTTEDGELLPRSEILEGQVSVRFEGGDESANKRRNHAACCRAAAEEKGSSRERVLQIASLGDIAPPRREARDRRSHEHEKLTIAEVSISFESELPSFEPATDLDSAPITRPIDSSKHAIKQWRSMTSIPLTCPGAHAR